MPTHSRLMPCLLHMPTLLQADKAWAIYRQLVPGPQQAQQAEQVQQAQQAQQVQQQQGSLSGGQGAGAEAGPAAQRMTQDSAACNPTADSAAEAAAAADLEHHAWEERLAARQRALDSTAEQLVRDLRLDSRPLDEYGYGALLTALSRVSWLDGCG